MKPSKRTRLWQIIKVLRQYNVLHDFTHQTHPEQVRQAFIELGPTFIKVGQMLSTRTDLVTPEFANALKELQDQVPADDFTQVKATIEAQTGQPLTAQYQQFEQQAFASASMGQAHHAVTKSGQQVVVKVQHPNIRAAVITDLALFQKAISLLKFVPEASVIDPQAIFREIKHALFSELNMQLEITNGQRFYELNNDWDIIRVPKIDTELSQGTVLVNQAMPGKSIASYLPDMSTTQRQYLADTLVHNFLKQVFTDGFFHADPHPGNILLTQTKIPPVTQTKRTFQRANLTYTQTENLPAYRLVYLDFGMMGQLTPALITGLANVVIAVTSKDSRQIGQAVLVICNRVGTVDEESFYQQLGAFMQPYFNAGLGEIDFESLLYGIIQLCRANQLQMKPEVTLLLKAFGVLEGTVAQLAPDLSMLTVAQQFAKDYFQQHFDWRHESEVGALRLWQLTKAVPQLPLKLLSALEIFERGDTKVNLEFKQRDGLLDRLEAIINRLVIAIILAALIIGSSLLVQSRQPGDAIAKLGLLGYSAALLVMLSLLGSNLYHRYQRWHHKH
ncbi:ABC1 kinase family protein [Loigolactobacillus zhaoyuanensis]|uniref:ABC1 kinase family protein n=1 Tax=Loigolactobacillus zhaoyuanensis TaxID=2486017 RepID=UPI000F743287|nr:AarF/UbiB family protein [Loigolactobacillus zhaoyuanensis]